ncbi:unnamed protein product, partial [Acidocella sp. C78]
VIERAAKASSEGYPPYNIEQLSSTSLRITIAVAGFTMDDLQITQEDNQLVIRGRQNDDMQGRIFLHRGIAARQFQRAFVLAEGIEVKGAWLDNGLLHIDLARPLPEAKIRTIAIKKGAGGQNGASTARTLDSDAIASRVVAVNSRRVPDMNIKAHDGIADDAPFQAFLDPHHITESQLADLGLQEIAYVRPIMTPSGPAFGVFAANGRADGRRGRQQRRPSSDRPARTCSGLVH